MNEPIDIKALDEYLKGGSEVSQRYRELGRDDVPPELDRRVLEEACAAVANGGAQRTRSWLRWSAPVALAASVVLVVTVVIENGVPKETAYVVAPASEESKLYQEPAAPARAPAPAEQFVPEAPVARPAAADKRERGASTVMEEVKVEAPARRDQAADAVLSVTAEPQLATQQAIAPAAAEAEADSDLSEVTVTGGVRSRRATGRTAGPRNTISPAGLSSAETRQSAVMSAAPEKWLERIRDLRRTGRIADADLEWQRFREAYPDFAVAEDDIARKH